MSGGSPTVRRRRLGHALRSLRLSAGVNGDVAGEAVERTASWISRLEAGRVGIRTIDLRQLLDLYNVTDPIRRKELEDLAKEGQKRAWWSRYTDSLPESYSLFIGLEAEAVAQRVFTNSVVPGLLQTRSYCRATIEQGLLPTEKRSPQVIEKRVEARMTRQLLLQQQDPLRLSAIIDESVLHRSIGGAAVLRDQLGHLIEMAHQPFVDLRVLPFAHSDRIVLVTAFTVLSFPQDPDVVYVETATGGVYENESDVQLYMDIFRQLEAASLDAEASVAALRRALKGLT
jgi:hypothetical protein